MNLLVMEPHPSFGGGSEAVVLQLSRELSSRGHRIFLVHRTEGTMLPAYRRFVAEIRCIPLYAFGWRSPLRVLNSVRWVGRLAKEWRIDAAFCSEIHYIRLAALIRRLVNLPFAFHLGLNCTHSEATYRWAYRSINAGIAPSAHTAGSWLAGGWPRGRLFCIRNWVDAERFAPARSRDTLRQELNLPVAAPLAVYAGRICPEKGVEFLLRAFAAAKRHVPEARLALIGGCAQWYESALQSVCDELQLSGCVIRCGVTVEPERYLAAADAAVVLSLCQEPFGLALIEAMSCGIPTIATGVGVLPELLGPSNSGMVVAPNDISALSAAIQFWLTHPAEAAEKGMRMRERACAHYGAAQPVAAYQAVLSALAADRPLPAPNVAIAQEP